MGFFKKLLKKDDSGSDTASKRNSANKSSNTLLEDIHISSDWVVTALNSSGYKADYSLDSMKEIDRFFDEQSSETGIISKNRGYILFSLGAYVGETVIKLYGGEWITDDNDPQGEINIAVKLADGTIIWPALRCIKRYQLGSEEGIYAYVWVLGERSGADSPSPHIS
ncbi:MAG: hypothetical protein K2O32_02165 [Acetatifactor sp.]|nr:hypothetical protein [Acetatifactor sp.]